MSGKVYRIDTETSPLGFDPLKGHMAMIVPKFEIGQRVYVTYAGNYGVIKRIDTWSFPFRYFIEFGEGSSTSASERNLRRDVLGEMAAQ